MLQVVYLRRGSSFCCCSLFLYINLYINGDFTTQHAKNKRNFLFPIYLLIYYEILTTSWLDRSRSCNWSPLLSVCPLSQPRGLSTRGSHRMRIKQVATRAEKVGVDVAASSAACCFFHPLIIGLTSLNLNLNRVRNVAWAPSNSTRCVINDWRITTVH